MQNKLLKVKSFHKNINNKLLLTDKEYTELTIKTLKYLYSKKQLNDVKYRLLRYNEDYFSYIKSAVMMADWKFNSDKAKISTWRIQCIKWEIYRILFSDNYKQENTTNFSEYEFGQDLNIEDLFYKNQDYDKIEIHEIYNKILNIASKTLDVKSLSIFKMHFEHYETIKEIARLYETSYSEIKNSISKSLQKIRRNIYRK